jgi:hypothetical protein
MKTKLHHLFVMLALLVGIHPTAAKATSVFPIATNKSRFYRAVKQ